MQGQNLKLLVAVIVSGVITFAAITTNFSASKFISEKMNGYTSPYGPRPSRAFVDQWESERAR